MYLLAARARVFLLEFLFSIIVVGMTPFQLVLAGIVAEVFSRCLSVLIGMIVAERLKGNG